ncbi:hypothetical protein Tco_0596639 [Tanacetum coccineum]
MDEYNALVVDVKSRMRRDAVRRVARVPVSLNELEINESYSARDCGGPGSHVIFRRVTRGRESILAEEAFRDGGSMVDQKCGNLSL